MSDTEHINVRLAISNYLQLVGSCHLSHLLKGDMYSHIARRMQTTFWHPPTNIVLSLAQASAGTTGGPCVDPDQAAVIKQQPEVVESGKTTVETDAQAVDTPQFTVADDDDAGDVSVRLTRKIDIMCASSVALTSNLTYWHTFCHHPSRFCNPLTRCVSAR